jgi:hypothetical protein
MTELLSSKSELFKKRRAQKMPSNNVILGSQINNYICSIDGAVPYEMFGTLHVERACVWLHKLAHASKYI